MIGRLIALVVCLVAVASLYFLYEEQRQTGADTVTVYHPGTYQGPADAPLDPARREELRQRARSQSSI